jgi:hypothetical protein
MCTGIRSIRSSNSNCCFRSSRSARAAPLLEERAVSHRFRCASGTQGTQEISSAATYLSRDNLGEDGALPRQLEPAVSLHRFHENRQGQGSGSLRLAAASFSWTEALGATARHRRLLFRRDRGPRLMRDPGSAKMASPEELPNCRVRLSALAGGVLHALGFPNPIRNRV